MSLSTDEELLDAVMDTLRRHRPQMFSDVSQNVDAVAAAAQVAALLIVGSGFHVAPDGLRKALDALSAYTRQCAEAMQDKVKEMRSRDIGMSESA